jgi:hypothetical protein
MLSQEYSSLPHTSPVQMLVDSPAEITNGSFFPTLLDPGVQSRLCLARCKASLLDPMMLHPVVGQHVAGAVPTALVAVLVQPCSDTRDDKIVEFCSSVKARSKARLSEGRCISVSILSVLISMPSCSRMQSYTSRAALARRPAV